MRAISCLLTLCYFNSKLFESFRGKLQRFLLKIRHGGGGSPSGARQGRGKVGQQASATVPLARVPLLPPCNVTVNWIISMSHPHIHNIRHCQVFFEFCLVLLIQMALMEMKSWVSRESCSVLFTHMKVWCKPSCALSYSPI